MSICREALSWMIAMLSLTGCGAAPKETPPAEVGETVSTVETVQPVEPGEIEHFSMPDGKTV